MTKRRRHLQNRPRQRDRRPVQCRLIFVLLILAVTACEDQQRVAAIKKDMLEYEGLPDPWATCVAKNFIAIASDEEADAWIALTRGDGAAALRNEKALHNAEEKWKDVYGQCIESGSASPIAETPPTALSPHEIIGTEQYPLPKAGYWRGTEKTHTQWFALNGKDKTEEKNIETCLVGDWQVSLNDDPDCKSSFSRIGNGVIEFSSDCSMPTGGRAVTNTRIEYSAKSSRITIVSEIIDPKIKPKGPVLQTTAYINERWVDSQCPDNLLTGF